MSRTAIVILIYHRHDFHDYFKQQPVVLCKPDFIFRFQRLYATSVNSRPSSL
jgi:hypothetical protein